MVISNDLKPGMSFKYDNGIYTVAVAVRSE